VQYTDNQHHSLSAESAEKFRICGSDDCRQPFRASEEKCPACGMQEFQEIECIRPDAFRAKKSKSSAGFAYESRGSSHQVFSGASGAGKLVPKTSLQTTESSSGELFFLNTGPEGRGFGGICLYHDIRTDIVVWSPHPQIYTSTSWQTMMGSPKRLENALNSALQAILRATTLELEVKYRDIGGLVHPVDEEGKGFVLYDASPGGSVTVIDLSLIGDPAVDQRRSELIRRILEKAMKLCSDCLECNASKSFESMAVYQTPVTRVEYLKRTPGEDKREFQSCYRCLRHFSNQRVQEHLDRFDAWLILNELSQDRGIQEIPATVATRGKDRGDKVEEPPHENMPMTPWLPEMGVPPKGSLVTIQHSVKGVLTGKFSLGAVGHPEKAKIRVKPQGKSVVEILLDHDRSHVRQNPQILQPYIKEISEGT